MILEGKYQDLVNLSVLKLDDEYLFKNENYEANFSPHHKTVKEFFCEWKSSWQKLVK